MSLDLGSLLQNQLGNVLGQFLTNNGEASDASSKAAGLAIPAVMAGLVKYVSNDGQHGGKLFEMLSGASGSTLTGVLNQTAHGTDYKSFINMGKSLLPSMLGGSAADASDVIANESGISKVSAGSLMALALPLVLSFLRNHVKDNNLNQEQFLSLFSNQQSWLSKALDGKLLSALGISSLSGLFGSFNKMAASLAMTPSVAAATGNNGSGAGKWIAMAIGVGLLAFAAKSCTDNEKMEAPATPSVMSSEPVAASTSDITVVPVATEASVPVADVDAVTPITDTARVTYENGVATFFFATGKNNVVDGAQAVVADVIAAGKDGKKLIVSGFTDSTGDATANEELSKNRAQAVQAFLEAQGVSAANIELRKPDNTTGAVGNDVEGRRVEVKVEE